jgi:hypothetical protein
MVALWLWIWKTLAFKYFKWALKSKAGKPMRVEYRLKDEKHII